MYAQPLSGISRGRPQLLPVGGLTGGAQVWSTGRVHDHCDADQADRGPDDVEAVRAVAVQDHAPDQGTSDEHPTISGQNPAEVGVGLQGGYEAIFTVGAARGRCDVELASADRSLATG